MNFYELTGPALVSFSGGRTSGYMLAHILEANGGLPENVHVTFANTGKERPETLDFVEECGQRWAVPIHWLEYDPGAGFREVSHGTAARAGEPFADLIRKKSYLPNPVTRFCTIELKIRVMKKFALSLGWEHWTNVIGLRADESHRFKNLTNGRERWVSVAPMIAARVTEDDIFEFWRKQPFDLRLRQHEGNCDLCFLKGAGKISAILRTRPDLAKWWIDREKELGKTFRLDRPSYAQMLDAVKRQQEFDFGIFDDLETCSSNACTD